MKTFDHQLANAEPYEPPVPAAGKVPPPPAPLKTSPTFWLTSDMHLLSSQCSGCPV